MYFSGFEIPPEDGLQAAAAGGLRAAPPEVLNASNYDKKAKLSIKKAERPRSKRQKAVQGDQSGNAEVHTSAGSNTANRESAATAVAAAASFALPRTPRRRRVGQPHTVEAPDVETHDGHLPRLVALGHVVPPQPVPGEVDIVPPSVETSHLVLPRRI